MLFASKHINASALARLFLLVVLLLGPCGLMVSVAFADDGYSHEHLSLQYQPHAVASIQMALDGDVCCMDAPALVSKGVSLPNPQLNGMVEDNGVGLHAAHAYRVTPSRAPPPSLYSARAHTRLQIYLV